MQAHPSGLQPGDPAPDAPLARLAQLQRAVGAGVDRLLGLASAARTDGAPRRCPDALRKLFDQLAPQLHAIEETYVYPALVESMAGSDPVCLREMAAASTREHRLLQRRWQALRPAIERPCAGSTDPIDVEALAAFAAAWRAHLAREQSELLPMAERLLDDAALDAIGRALDGIGGA